MTIFRKIGCITINLVFWLLSCSRDLNYMTLTLIKDSSQSVIMPVLSGKFEYGGIQTAYVYRTRRG
jgi:hypothetical protein